MAVNRNIALIIAAQFLVLIAAQDPKFSCNNKEVCVSSPPNCKASACQLVAFVERRDENTFTFQVSGKVTKGSYVAVGLSKDGQMGQDAVVACFSNGIQTFVNPNGHTPSQKMDWKTGSPTMSVSAYAGDYQTCSFDLPAKIDAGSGISFDLNDPSKVTLIVVSGLEQNMALQQHSADHPETREVMTSSLKSKNQDSSKVPSSEADKDSSTQAPSKASFVGSEVKYLAISSVLAVFTAALLKTPY